MNVEYEFWYWNWIFLIFSLWNFCLLHHSFHLFCFYLSHFWLQFCVFLEALAPNSTDIWRYLVLFIVVIFSICTLAFVTTYALRQCKWDEGITLILLSGCSICSCRWTILVPGYALALATTYVYYWKTKDEKITNVWHFCCAIIWWQWFCNCLLNVFVIACWRT